MIDVEREKYQKLMQEVADLEDKIAELGKDAPTDPGKLKKMQEHLAEQRNELTRISDGCGTPHSHEP